MPFPTHLGFPAPLLGDAPLRLPVHAVADNLIALEKPAGIAADAHPWNPSPLNIIDGLRHQQGKPELQAAGVGEAHLVNPLDVEASGLILIATAKATEAAWRDLFGSRLLRFRYELVVRPWEPLPDTFDVDLPVTAHDEAPKLVITHRRGKKSSTLFRRLERHGAYERWEALTDFPRLHQVRIHAADCRLPILGEHLYGTQRTPPILLSDLKRGYRPPKGDVGEAPLYPHLCLHLAQISWDAQPGRTEAGSVSAPLPDKWNVLWKKILAHAKP